MTLTKSTTNAGVITAEENDANFDHVLDMANMTGQNWRVYYSDGSGVVSQLALGAANTFLRSNGASSAPSFAVPGAAAADLGFYDAVNDYSAPYNDGSTEGADASAAINAAGAAAEAAGGGVVWIGPGTFWADESILYRSKVKFLGSGVYTTTIKKKAGNHDHIFTHADKENEVEFEHAYMTLDGNRDAGTNNRYWFDGINIGGKSSFPDPEHHIHDLFITNVTRDGVHIAGGRGAMFVSNINIGSCGRHGYFDKAYDQIQNNIYIGGIGADGVVLQGGTHTMSNVKAFFCGNGAKQFEDWPDDFFGNAKLGSSATGYDNGTPSGEDWRHCVGFHIQSCGGVKISNAESQDTYGPGLRINGAHGFQFTGGLFNVGDLAPNGPRNGDAGWGATVDRFAGTRAAVEINQAHDCDIRFVTYLQNILNTSQTIEMDYAVRFSGTNVGNVHVQAFEAKFDNSGSADAHVTNVESVLYSSTPTDRTTVEINGKRIAREYTVAGLPSSPTLWQEEAVSDADSPAVGSAVTGGASAKALVRYNGTQWTVVGI